MLTAVIGKYVTKTPTTASATVRATPSPRRPAASVVTRDDPHHGDLLALARVGVHDVRAGCPAEPGRLGLTDEDGRPLRAVGLLDPHLLSLVHDGHRAS